MNQQECEGFVFEPRSEFPPNSNPFHHDYYHMGVKIGENIYVMFAKHSDEVHDYVILVNTQTGKRVKVALEEVK